MSTDLEIYCPDCDSRFGYSGRIPRFCQYCGRSLIDQHPTAENLLTGAVNDSGLQTTEHDDQLTIAPTTPVAGSEPTRVVGNAEMVGPYRLVRWLGSGGMGTVWEAIETTSGRRVALKRLSKTMAVDEKYVKRFVREAQLCAKVSHPKVTFIYGSGQQQGQPYIAMELMPGETLADVLKHSGPLEIGYATECVIDVAEGLTAAHEIGLIHRDVKPSNCFVDADRSVKIGDFGLSKSILGKDPNLTRADTFMGTPTYAAPEQIRCEDVDQRTDVYAVGATLYSLLAGRPPFMGDALTVTAQIVTDEPPPISKFRDEVPKPLEKIIAKCLAKNPGKRFESLPDLKLALLPFTNRSDAAVANIGRRLAAFMIDQTIIQTIHFALLVVFLLVWISSMQFPANADSEQIQKLIQERTQPLAPYFAAFLLVLSVIYFSFLEGFFGRGVGKLVMGLKTVNQEGQIPGLQLAFLRTIIIPCCFGIPFLFQLYLLDRFGELNSYTMLIDFVATTTVRSMIAFGLLSTMRISRGMIGVHGILSQTRVIRTLNRKMKIPVLQPRKQKFDPVWFGPYESEQLMGESQFGQVYFGYDGPLKRAVWIVVRPKGKEPPLSRKML
ncbi:MAG: protein kinase, partial [Planctomycetota bacterium]